MTLKECYAALGGDYDAVLGRLPGEKFVQKFVLKFLNDGSYDLLLRSMEEQNYEEAFRAAHTIKGMCQNLDFTRLYRSSSALSEALRHGITRPRPAGAGAHGLRADGGRHPRLPGRSGHVKHSARFQGGADR